MSLAYYSARIYYTEIRELPTGEGYAENSSLYRSLGPHMSLSGTNSCHIPRSAWHLLQTWGCKYVVLTLLIHLGYLAYDFASQEVFIPNYEISGEFKTALQGAGWDAVVKAVDESEQLLRN